jgi:hypothetical protein
MQVWEAMCSRAREIIVDAKPEDALGLWNALLQHTNVSSSALGALLQMLFRYRDTMPPSTLCSLLTVLGKFSNEAVAEGVLAQVLTAVHAQAPIFVEQDWCDLWSACAAASSAFPEDSDFKCGCPSSLREPRLPNTLLSSMMLL